MNNQFEAIYFDGLTSNKQEISLSIDELSNALYLQAVDREHLLWEVADLSFDHYGKCLEIRNKTKPLALIQIEDELFIEDFYRFMKGHKKLDIHQYLLNLGFRRILIIAIALMSSIVCAYLFLLPPLAERSAKLLPTSFDDYIGELFMKEFLQDSKIDGRRTETLEQFASELKIPEQERLKFIVVKSDEVNAFALPNGQIVIYTAILDEMKSADELVALLGHESSHVSQRHSIKMLARNLSSYIFVSLVFSDVNAIMAVMAENAHTLNTLAYSRSFEQEADELGFEILKKNHINPQGMVNLFTRLERSGSYIPELIQTHPLLEKRKEYIQELIDEELYPFEKKQRLEQLFDKLKD